MSMLPLLCIVHVPKTAGSAIRETLISTLGRDQVYWIGHKRPREEWDRAPGTEFEDYAVVGGHVPPSEFDKIRRPKIFLGVVRDPVQRALSLFHYIVHGPDEEHPFRNALRGLTIAEAIERSAEFRAEVQNFQCYLIGGDTSFAGAVRCLSERDWLIDRHERIDELFARVCERFGWPVTSLLHDNVSERGYAARYMTEENVAAISAVNGQDNMLYAMLVAASDATAAREYWRSIRLDKETMKHMPQASWRSAALGSGVSAASGTPTAVTPAFVVITALYRKLLLREPDQAGLENYLEKISDGMPLEGIIGELLRSPEFGGKFHEFLRTYDLEGLTGKTGSVAVESSPGNLLERSPDAGVVPKDDRSDAVGTNDRSLFSGRSSEDSAVHSSPVNDPLMPGPTNSCSSCLPLAHADTSASAGQIASRQAAGA